MESEKKAIEKRLKEKCPKCGSEKCTGAYFEPNKGAVTPSRKSEFQKVCLECWCRW